MATNIFEIGYSFRTRIQNNTYHKVYFIREKFISKKLEGVSIKVILCQ